MQNSTWKTQAKVPKEKKMHEDFLENEIQKAKLLEIAVVTK